MKKFFKTALAVTTAAILFTACGPAASTTTTEAAGGSEAASGEMKTYILANLPNDAGKLSEATQAVVDEMNIALKPHNAKVEAIVADDYSVVAESILAGTANIGTPSGATYVKAHLENPNVIPMFAAAPGGDFSKSGYPAYIATKVENAKDFAGMDETQALLSLKGKPFSFVSATSTSGRLVPTQSFWEAFGPEGSKEVTQKSQIFENTNADGGIFSEVQYAGTHPANVDLILSGKVYAGAFCCDYAGDKFDQFHIIKEEMVPNGPYWVNKDYMEQEHIDALIAHFTALTPETAVEGMFIEGESSGDETLTVEDRWTQVNPEDYNFLEKMYEGE